MPKCQHPVLCAKRMHLFKCYTCHWIVIVIVTVWYAFMRFMHLHTPTIIDSHFYTEFRQARMPRDIPGVHNSIIASAIVQRTHTQF